MSRQWLVLWFPWDGVLGSTMLRWYHTALGVLLRTARFRNWPFACCFEEWRYALRNPHKNQTLYIAITINGYQHVTLLLPIPSCIIHSEKSMHNRTTNNTAQNLYHDDTSQQQHLGPVCHSPQRQSPRFATQLCLRHGGQWQRWGNISNKGNSK